MTKLLFICHGNICRSPMAEFVLKDLVHRAGLDPEFLIQSAATSAEELGNPVYPPVRNLLRKRGIDCSQKRARQITTADFAEFDLLIGMDQANLRSLNRMAGPFQHKVHLLLDYTDHPGSVADPWYTGDFERTWQDVTEGCTGLLKALTTR